LTPIERPGHRGAIRRDGDLASNADLDRSAGATAQIQRAAGRAGRQPDPERIGSVGRGSGSRALLSRQLHALAGGRLIGLDSLDDRGLLTGPVAAGNGVAVAPPPPPPASR